MPREHSPEADIAIKLTQVQRKIIAELFPQFTERVRLHEPNQRNVMFSAEELKQVQETIQGKLQQGVKGQGRHSLRLMTQVVSRALGRDQQIRSGQAAGGIYQLKITLLGIKPPIWRRIQVKDCTLDELHEHIQTAMGWTNSHMHQFHIGERRCGNLQLFEEDMEEFDMMDSTTTKLSDIFPASDKGSYIIYEYDFGDGWEHQILFEGIVPPEKRKKYPACVDGARACPPEDVGGVWGYEDFAQAITDPNHEQHQYFLEWSGPFNPEKFSAEKATRNMRQGLPRW